MKEHLERALELIRTSGWWSGHGKIDGFCALMAISASTYIEEGHWDPVEPTVKYLTDLLPKEERLVRYNDSHTQAEVEALFERAIAQA